MNFNLPDLPERTKKPRTAGLTMVMDKGLSLREAENMMESGSEYIDIVKLGFGSAVVTPKLKEKLAVYKNAGVPVYFGGTLFESYVARNMFEDYLAHDG